MKPTEEKRPGGVTGKGAMNKHKEALQRKMASTGIPFENLLGYSRVVIVDN